MEEDRWSRIDAYLEGQLLGPDPILEEVLRESERAGLPSIQVSALQGRLLGLLVESIGARAVLEIGTLGGYSAIWMARSLPPGGRLVTLELEPLHARVAQENFHRAGVDDRARLRLGPALESLQALRREAAGPFDLVFLDADKERYEEYLEAALELTRPGSLLVADNVVRAGEVMDPGSRDPRAQGIRRFLDRIAREPRLTATALQTVGNKGHDGFLLARVLPAR
jgi:predicted O-methyltransferase YrrM